MAIICLLILWLCNYTLCLLHLLKVNVEIFTFTGRCLCRKTISKFNQRTQYHIMKSNAICSWKTLPFLAKRSNLLFIAVKKFSFHLIRVSWSWLLTENSCVQIFWEKFSKYSHNHTTPVRTLKCFACRSLHSPQGWSTCL